MCACTKTGELGRTPIGRLAFPGNGDRSRFGLAFGVEGFGGEFAVGFFEEDFYAAFRFFELLLAFAGEDDAFFEELHGFVERKLGTFEAADDFFEAREGALKVGPLGRLGFFGGGLNHAVGLYPCDLFLAVRTKVCGTAAARGALDLVAATAAWLSFAIVDAKNFFQALKPPGCVAKIGRRMQTAF